MCNFNFSFIFFFYEINFLTALNNTIKRYQVCECLILLIDFYFYDFSKLYFCAEMNLITKHVLDLTTRVQDLYLSEEVRGEYVVLPSKKKGHIALHMSVGWSLGLSFCKPFCFRSITRECLDLTSSNSVHTSILGSRGTLFCGHQVKGQAHWAQMCCFKLFM